MLEVLPEKLRSRNT